MREKPRTILIVDDEPDVARVFGLILARYGYRVVSATSGTHGCSLAVSEEPALIFCDERMPGLDGYATLRELKANAVTARIPVVMMGGTHEDGVEDWRSEGAEYFLSKPFPVSEVLDLVRRLVKDEPTPAA